MLTKEQFIEAMNYFEEATKLQNKITESIEQFVDGKVIFTADLSLWENHLRLIENAMNITDEDNPIADWLYEADNKIFDEPDENGICRFTGETLDHKFLTYYIDKKKIIINNTSELYDFIVQL